MRPAEASAETVVRVAGPFVEHVSPPALCRGQTNRIELIGRELSGAFDLWTSTPGVQLKAKLCEENDGERASFDVEVPADAPLGLYGFRLATRSGLSNVHVFLIDELPIQSRESSSASSASSPMKVTLPAAIHSRCRAATVDRYEIEVEPGQAVTFEVVGNRFGKDYDPLVRIRDAQGRIVAERDNDAGLFFDCRFRHTFSDGGVYYVEVRDARFADDPTWHYVLRMGDFPAARVAVPSSVTPGELSRLQLPQVVAVPPLGGPDEKGADEAGTPTLGAVVEVTLPAETPVGWLYQEVRLVPEGLSTWLPLHADRLARQVESETNDDRDAATQITLPTTLHGVLEQVGDHDWFKFDMKQGKSMTFRSEARAFGSPADLELILLDPDGKEVRRIDDVPIRVGLDSWSIDAKFDFYAAKDGPHYLCVREMTGDGGLAFAYRVEITDSGPKLELRSDVARATVPRGNFQPVPLTVTRLHFAGPIELELLGAPAGVTLEPTTIPADVSEIVCHLKADASTPEGLATIQIAGRWKSDDPNSELTASAVAATFPLIDRRVKDNDLRVSALREDQRRLPPSLTNRLALLVTPPAPFDVQLPEAQLLITKYLDGEFPIATTRIAGFDAPISFAADGGQLGDEAEERSNIFLRLPVATPNELDVSALVFNRILTNYGKFRVDFRAMAIEGDRRVVLKRTFELEVKAAFAPVPEATTAEIEPGGTAKIRLLANRTSAFDGIVTLAPTPLNGFEPPEKIEIPAGEPHVDIEVKAAPETAPGAYALRFVSRGQVGKYEEEVNGPSVTITIKKPPVEKKR